MELKQTKPVSPDGPWHDAASCEEYARTLRPVPLAEQASLSLRWFPAQSLRACSRLLYPVAACGRIIPEILSKPPVPRLFADEPELLALSGVSQPFALLAAVLEAQSFCVEPNVGRNAARAGAWRFARAFRFFSAMFRSHARAHVVSVRVVVHSNHPKNPRPFSLLAKL